MMRNTPLWENQVTFYDMYKSVLTSPLFWFTSDVATFRSRSSRLGRLAVSPLHTLEKPLTKFLEKFSKNLYGTTGGTYSSRFRRPVMIDDLLTLSGGKLMTSVFKYFPNFKFYGNDSRYWYLLIRKKANKVVNRKNETFCLSKYFFL